MGSICSLSGYTGVNKLKKKALIYGAGNNFINQFNTITKLYQIVRVIDGDPDKLHMQINGFSVEAASEENIKLKDYDQVIVTPKDNTGILNRLRTLGIADDQVITISQIFDRAFYNRPLQIAIIFYGGMGDFLIGRNWLCYLSSYYSLEEECFDVYIDLAAYDRGKEVFNTCEQIKTVLPIHTEYTSLMDTDKYDLVMRFCIFPYVQSFAGDVIKKRNKLFLEYILKLQSFGYENYCVGFRHNQNYYKVVRRLMEVFADKQYHNYCDLFGNLGIKEKFLFSLPTNVDERAFLDKYGLWNRRFITIDTGLNKDYKGGSSTRAWRHSNWDKLALEIKSSIPEVVTVQVGEKMSDEDDIHVDINLNGKTDIYEIRVLMKYAAVHVDYDGGLVHVRHILQGGPSVVLFGPTAVNRHTSTENIGIRTDVCKYDCEWMTERWLFDCPKGLEKPICMDSIDPKYVSEMINKLLSNSV